MSEATNIALSMLMGISLVVLMLETIGERQLKSGFLDKPHIRLLAIGALLASFFLIFFELYQNAQLPRRPFSFLSKIASLFLIANTTIALFIDNPAQRKIQTSETYFLLLASLALSISNVSTTSLVLKMTTSIGWLVAMTALVIRSTEGGKKAEIGLKMSYAIIMITLLFLFAVFLLGISHHSLDLNILVINNESNISLAFLALMLAALAGVAMTGAPPFHFGHVDCADGGPINLAFLFLTNSAIQGCALLVGVKTVLLKSGIGADDEAELLALMLIFGFVILYLRALDQIRIRRTAAYIATSVGSLTAMSILFGTSALLPKLVFLLAIYAFLSLTLFTLYGSLALMDPWKLPWMTWEDISGFGRMRPLPTLTFLVALASIGGLPGTIGYFIKLSLIAPLHQNLWLSGAIFLSIAIGAACVMRVFVFIDR